MKYILGGTAAVIFLVAAIIMLMSAQQYSEAAALSNGNLRNLWQAQDASTIRIALVFVLLGLSSAIRMFRKRK